MKYLIAVRHAMSVENMVHQWKVSQPLYREFISHWSRNELGKDTIKLARKVRTAYRLPFSDKDMPVFDTGQALMVGSKLKRRFPKPDLIFVSPYRRAIQTLLLMQSSIMIEALFPNVSTIGSGIETGIFNPRFLFQYMVQLDILFYE